MTKSCEICQTRPIMTAKQRSEAGTNFPYCLPCLNKAEMENAHSDYNHDAITNGEGDADEWGGQAEYDAVKADMAGCWVCHPGQDETSATYVQRAGTSRAGMRLTVSIRAAGRTKADQVKAQLPEGFKATVRVEKGITVLRAKGPVTIVLRWNEMGAYAGGTVQATNGTVRKVRNASEALRYAGV